MKNILKLNAISSKVNDVFTSNYTLTDNADDAVAILVRSFNMHEYTPSDSVLCVGRAGAGTNNIPVGAYAEKGIVVFNTPGANANAVKELVLGALFLSSRKIVEGINWSNGLADGEKTVAEQVEKGKKAFGGCEILGKTLGVYGLGAIGRKITISAYALGMNVIGYDPYLSPNDKIEGVKILSSKEELFENSDYITLHVPLTNETRGLINEATISTMKDGVKIINCSRGEIVDSTAIINATKSKKVSCYVTDFPSSAVINQENVICIPHLGASTEEAEDNCAIMAAEQIVDYVENGNIVNSVNYPRLKVEKTGARTVILVNSAKVDEIKALCPADATFSSATKGDFAVCFIDGKTTVSSEIIAKIEAVGVIKIRQI